MRTSALAPGTPQQLLSGYPNSASTPRRGGQPVVNAYQLQLLREGGHSRRSATGSDAACGHFSAFHRLPTKPTKVVERMQSRGYIGQFTKDGELFVGKTTCYCDFVNLIMYYLLAFGQLIAHRLHNIISLLARILLTENTFTI